MGHHSDVQDEFSLKADGHCYIAIFYHIGSGEIKGNQILLLTFLSIYLHIFFLQELSF